MEISYYNPDGTLINTETAPDSAPINTKVSSGGLLNNNSDIFTLQNNSNTTYNLYIHNTANVISYDTGYQPSEYFTEFSVFDGIIGKSIKEIGLYAMNTTGYDKTYELGCYTNNAGYPGVLIDSTTFTISSSLSDYTFISNTDLNIDLNVSGGTIWIGILDLTPNFESVNFRSLSCSDICLGNSSSANISGNFSTLYFNNSIGTMVDNMDMQNPGTVYQPNDPSPELALPTDFNNYLTIDKTNPDGNFSICDPSWGFHFRTEKIEISIKY